MLPSSTFKLDLKKLLPLREEENTNHLSSMRSVLFIPICISINLIR